MRVLHIFSFLSPNANGTINIIRKLSMALARREHEVGVFTSDFEMTDEYKYSLYPVRIYAYSSWFNKPGLYLYSSPSLVLEARKVIKEFDILHLHCLRSVQNIVVYNYARKYGIPYVLDQHGSLPRFAAGETGYKWLLRWLFDITFGNRILRNAAKVVAQNDFAVKEYKKFGVEDDKIALIPLLFPIEDFADLPSRGKFRERYGIGEKRVIMFFGRIARIKGLDFLVESFYELFRSRQDIVLAIVGPDDGYQAKLKNLVSELNLAEQVLFTGFLSGRDKLAALVDADVVVQPSRYEQAAWAPVEALLCGTPVIVSGHSGAGEDISRMDAGYLVEYGDKNQMVRVIQSILDDPAKAKAKVNRAKEYITDNLSFTKRIEDYEKLYSESIRGNRQARRNE